MARTIRWEGWRAEGAAQFRPLAIAVAAGAFLGFAGAFGTDDAPLVLRLALWTGQMLVATLWGVFVARWIPLSLPRWAWIPLVAVLIAGPITGLVAATNTGVLHRRPDPGHLASLFAVVLLVSLVMTTINWLVESRAAAPETHAAPAPPKFLDRLPPKLRGAEVWAVEAEDHYLRIHTSKGQDLILLRLADAISELEGLEGAQVHRSWWVARDALVDARRGDGRAVLTLKDGSEVPVSRTYARLLRERNWF
jgi:hypothetical protein